MINTQMNDQQVKILAIREIVDELRSLLIDSDKTAIPEEIPIQDVQETARYFQVSVEDMLVIPIGILQKLIDQKLGSIEVEGQPINLQDILLEDRILLPSKSLKILHKIMTAILCNEEIRCTSGDSLPEITICYKCEDHQSISKGSLCRQCWMEANSKPPTSEYDDLKLYKIINSKSFDALDTLFEKTKIYMKVDSQVLDEFLGNGSKKMRIFVHEKDLGKIDSFIKTLRKTASINVESDIITAEMIEIAYTAWSSRQQ